ncbi:MAG TPA: AlpA family phage regulatory protein [Rhodanobacter sp.]|nr:AlpA family phage regulatory protein [Rhodanobacter sp.]
MTTESLLPIKAPPGCPSTDGVCGRTGLKTSTIYTLVREGRFPAPVKLGKSSRWPSSEIDAFIAALIAERDLQRATGQP